MRINFLVVVLILFTVTFNVNAGNENNNSQDANKKKTDCSAFDIKGRDSSTPTLKLTPVDTSIIPADFPVPPPGSEVCGCHKFAKTAYYLTNLNKEEIFDYYRKALNAEDFFVRDVTRGSTASLFVMQFAGDKAVGEIYFFEDKSGFGIKYVPKKPCNCPDKNKKEQ